MELFEVLWVLAVCLLIYSLLIFAVIEPALKRDEKKNLRVNTNSFVVKHCYLPNVLKNSSYTPKNICSFYWGTWVSVLFNLLAMLVVVTIMALFVFFLYIFATLAFATIQNIPIIFSNIKTGAYSFFTSKIFIGFILCVSLLLLINWGRNRIKKKESWVAARSFFRSWKDKVCERITPLDE